VSARRGAVSSTPLHVAAAEPALGPARHAVSVLWVMVLVATVLVSTAPLVRAQDGEPWPCEPVTRDGVASVAARLGLTEAQAAWLEAERAGGRLRGPDDLLGLPDPGGELLDDLDAAFCWDGAGLVSAAARRKGDAISGEARVAYETARVGAGFRHRVDPGASGRTRGGVWGGTRGWMVAAGSIRARHGLGLLVATPGTEARGRAPATFGREGWDVALGLETGRTLGAAAEHRWGGWRITAAGLRERETPDTAPWWTAVGLSRRRGPGRLGASWARGPGGSGVAIRGTGNGAGGLWSAEASRAGGGTALAALWRLDGATWGLRGSAQHLGAGYRDPGAWSVSEPWDDAASSVRWEARWRPGSGRLMRAGLRLERLPERAGQGWPRRRRGLEIELTERPGPGLRLGLLWRADLEAPEGVVSPGTDARVVRVDLERRQNGATARLRVEERLEGVGRSRAIAAQWGPSPRLALRAAWFGGDPDGPEIWWYRRRAGSLYGWDRLTPGTWLGAWGRLGVWGVVLEASVDATASGVDVALAVRAGG